MIELREFVDAAEIDPVFYEKAYYAGPRDDDDLHRLLREALGAQRAGRNRAVHLPRPRVPRRCAAAGDALLVHTMRFHDEVVDPGDLDLGTVSKKPAKREVEMAGKLVDDARARVRPGDFEDTYRDSVLDLIKRKAKGEEIDLAAEEEPEHGDDLAAALEASVSAGS